ncbi:MAG: hypothetical protein KGM15_15925 [Pseudomonadota bacterium]|nr:hypothetical protein [Pseudomonadota bacterium]
MFLVLGAIFGLGLLTFIVSLKDVALTIMMGSLGFGFPLIFAPTLIPYLAACLPLFVGERFLTARMALTGAALLLVAAGPYSLARSRLARLNEGLPKSVAQAPARLPRTVEIRGGGANCDAACASLLQSGQVDWVRQPSMITRAGKSTPETMLYMAGDGHRCLSRPLQKPFCATEFPDSGARAELELDVTSQAEAEVQGVAPFLLDRVSRVNVRGVVKGEGGRVVYDRTVVQATTVGWPTLISARIDGMSSEGLELYKNDGADRSLPVVDALKAVGYKLP